MTTSLLMIHLKCPVAYFDSLKLPNVSNISLKKEPPIKHKFFIFLKGGLFVMGGPIDINVGIF